MTGCLPPPNDGEFIPPNPAIAQSPVPPPTTSCTSRTSGGKMTASIRVPQHSGAHEVRKTSNVPAADGSFGVAPSVIGDEIQSAVDELSTLIHKARSYSGPGPSRRTRSRSNGYSKICRIEKKAVFVRIVHPVYILALLVLAFVAFHPSPLALYHHTIMHRLRPLILAPPRS
ncbi:uncharacterized protein SCHCODRAFT_02241609 [Schizophyllum commune H4-8]|uniref:uncharacterized protein n=1 Tax=Schizophyllum commune (strain H4-8 / FGSC 9210) TaxID=578458 RepID=UPI002160A745|nr:uncharacterized protein SCHCODRAFT_02241609 [Schizophyllum commune H4-8]KAI5895865.1 hypothetical protein SCHCODRAFT_02241609 [Schizophyllum commune H4-8]